jgi:hypothetical protein
MLKEYESVISNVCMVNNWRHLPQEERQGAIGVGVVLAYMKGVKPNVVAMARHLNLPPSEIDTPLNRLSTNGVFSTRYDVKNDDALLGRCGDLSYAQMKITESSRMRRAWGIIAGIASGLTGLR